MTEQFINLGATTLSADIGPADTSFTVDDGSRLPPTAGPFRVRIDSELILCTGHTGDLVAVGSRAIEQATGGGAAAAHNKGASVLQVLTLAGLSTFLDERYKTLSAYQVSIASDGITYIARPGSVATIYDFDVDIGALLNRLFIGGNVVVDLVTPGVYNAFSIIAPPANGCTLRGLGPITTIKAQASGAWTAGSNHEAGSYMVDTLNGWVGRKWILVQDVVFDCNNLAEGGVRYMGLVSDTSQWNLFYRNFVKNFRVVGLCIEDQSVAGGTRQHIEENKIGPGTTGIPQRGMDLRCNDFHMLETDFHGITDVGIRIAPRGQFRDKGVGSWFIQGGHVAVSGSVSAGGVSPDTKAVNVFCEATTSSGEISRLYVDNVQRYGIYFRPGVGRKQHGCVVRDSWFNGQGLVDAHGSDKAVAVVFDGSLGGPVSIWYMQVLGNRVSGDYFGPSGTDPTAGSWLAIVSVKGGLTEENNYISVDHNKFLSTMNLWDPKGIRPDFVGDDNVILPTARNRSDGVVSEARGHWTPFQNLIQNPQLVDGDADGFPDLWTVQGNGVITYPGGVFQLAGTSVSQEVFQDLPVIPGKIYSFGADAKVVTGTQAKLAFSFRDETNTQIPGSSGGGNAVTTPSGPTGGFQTLALLSQLAPTEDGHFTGTVDIVSGTAAIVAKTGTFPNDTTNPFVISGAGAGGTDLVTTIQTYTDATHVTLAAAPQATIQDAVWTAYGHGNAVFVEITLKSVNPQPNTLQWKNIVMAQGSTITGQAGTNTVWTITHGLARAPIWVDVTPANAAAVGCWADPAATDANVITVRTPSATNPEFYWRAAV